MSTRLGGALFVEFVGTFALVFCGMLVCNHADLGLVGIALGHGIILATMVSAAIPTSGGHFNPAVTVSFIATRKINPVHGVSYIVIQLLAGTVAALLISICHVGNDPGIVVRNGVPDFTTVDSTIAVTIECIATFFLVFVVWGTGADPRARNVGGFAIGLTVAADILAFGPLTGASMNPARSFGPTLVSSMMPIVDGASLWPHHWVYWVGPIVGGLLAGLIYQNILWPKEPTT